MELKKNPEVEVGRNSSLYFAVGMLIMMVITNLSLEFKSYDKSEIALDFVSMDAEYEEEIPITNINTPPPPPPPLVVTESITIVEDVAEVEETIIESSETNQDDYIEERIVSVDEVEVEGIEEDIEVPFAVIESVPIFPGCEGGTREQISACFQAKMQEHVISNFRYPETAMELGIHGKVYVLFTIDKTGKITNIQSRGPDKLLEREAERIIGLLPLMTPGKQRGKPVKVPYSIPINFKYIEQ